MKITFLIVLIIVTQARYAQDIDFLSLIKGFVETSKALGIQKLSQEKQAALNALRNRAYQLGVEGVESQVNPGLWKVRSGWCSRRRRTASLTN